MEETMSMISQNIKNFHVPNNKKLPLYGPLYIQDQDTFLQEEAIKFYETYMSPYPFQLKIDNFDVLYQIGAGAFGVVALVKYKLFGSYYAMKILNKKNVVLRKSIKRALNEKLMLQSLNCPFTIYMVYFSQDNSNLYFILPLVYGGELCTWLTQFIRFSENLSRFYAAQIVLAFEYLHRCSVVYRDLKPENVLLDHYGFVKITDFGLAKFINHRTYTFCGTADYLAPEIILGRGYGKAVDWWALGVFIFEMSTGESPFRGPDEESTFENIAQHNYVLPKDFSENLKDLVTNLLQSDLTRRMGNLKSGVDDIKNHSWFKNVNWLALLNRSVIPPFIPTSGINSVVFPGMKKMSDMKISVEDEYEDYFADF